MAAPTAEALYTHHVVNAFHKSIWRYVNRNNFLVDEILSSTANKGTNAKNIMIVNEDVGQAAHNNNDPTKTRMKFEYLNK